MTLMLSAPALAERFAVMGFRHPNDAERHFEREPCDLVLLDFQLPGRDGLSLLRRIKQLQPAVEVIIVTGHGSIQLAVEATRAGAFDFLTKPVEDPAAVLLRLEAALPMSRVFHYGGHGRYVDAHSFESALPLAGGTSLEVGDVLSLGAVPPFVFLFGCETARAQDLGGVQGLSLAHAFVAAGAEQVVAAVRNVDDATTSALVEHFYDALAHARAHVPRALGAGAQATREHERAAGESSLHGSCPSLPSRSSAASPNTQADPTCASARTPQSREKAYWPRKPTCPATPLPRPFAFRPPAKPSCRWS